MIREEPRRIEVHRSLIRPILLGGAEPEFTILNVTLIAMLLFGCGLYLATFITALLLATLGQACLVMMAKADPHMFQVYRRYSEYHDFYPAQASVQAKSPQIKSSLIRG